MAGSIIDCSNLTKYESSIVRRATAILERATMRQPTLCSSGVAKQHLVTRYSATTREVFGMLFLDAQNRLITIEDLFQGTLMSTSVFPREVVRAALLHNAAAVMFVHNHPSGNATPSEADKTLTRILIAALRLVDVKVLDHFVVGGVNCFSFAEQGVLDSECWGEVLPPAPPAKKEKGGRRAKAKTRK